MRHYTQVFLLAYERATEVRRDSLLQKLGIQEPTTVLDHGKGGAKLTHQLDPAC